ncbi:hypothetical protein COCVIDRAFT_39894 [Bipolaris victoriae FI3]|uniref:Peptidase S53 domain-containing protein n=1 Tax=Bipolaris victoriae (strain FI3) TaxID=930091 RepID=W7E2F7_BIPV3|nr:hypothetical protein COCVIDRAFT_39894 [Bipolaris victoriae FI3]
MRLLGYALFSLSSFVGTTLSTRNTVHEKRDTVSSVWEKHSAATGNMILPVRIGLKQQNLENAERFLQDISDPDSPNYAANTFAPHQEATETTLGWLCDLGIASERMKQSVGRNWWEFSATIAELEKLLETRYFNYQHKKSDNLTHCATLMTINCLRALYGFPAGKFSSPENELGIPERTENLSFVDLDEFFAKYSPPRIPTGTVPEIAQVNEDKTGNGNGDTGPSLFEAEMDVQTAYSIIWLQQIRVYQVHSPESVDAIGPFNVFLDALEGSYCTYLGANETGMLQCGGVPLSNVISLSFGQVEGDGPKSYQERQCHEWMNLALQGVSVLIVSGDSGVANMVDGNNECLDANGKSDGNGNGKRFSPGFPSNCPYVTVVGATTLRDGTISSGEMVVKDIYSPKYDSSVFNSSGRAYTDVSAIGLHIPVVYGNHPEMFNDVTVGSNPGCSTEGFVTSPGWDPVTGLGTLRYEKMREVFLSLP